MPTSPSDLAYVPFVSVADMMALVHARGLQRVLSELTDAIEAEFRRWEEYDKTPRVAAHSPGGVIELMPVADDESYAFKYVNGHPQNTRRGYQTVTAFGVLSRVDTGYPILLSEMTVLTALRTAATSAMAARALAAPDPQVMAMIGNGAQCEFQAEAFRGVLGVTRLRLYDIDEAATRKASANLAAAGFEVTACASAQEAVTGAQIVTTCTADKQYATILTDNMVGAGMHLNAIGGDCPGKTELHPDILARAATFVEYPPQTRIEGEIQQMPEDYAVTELWQVLTGAAQGRQGADQITLFDSVGFAIEDLAALKYVHRCVTEGARSVPLDLLADPDDPRDLYGMLRRAAP
ncbi:ornithine cyclodeaminase [Pseudoroseicyclus aestuarii]|uniref:Ornithine cyclodeaminase n=1 Tax=Pseudoroseicyclus aestuarii TaxID=1795041 RepID=A0A318SPQ8_9RHOB|nr:ornithine cyclodeaminase [Pseudoroseicyclus aestuarii]PYE83861.1 ornithine cyclodeaminase [Pseudoroseicyclus aestuarii]